jgi:type VI secretion system secreted protein Hcp
VAQHRWAHGPPKENNMARNLYINFPGATALKGLAKGNEMAGKDAIEILDVSNGLNMATSGAVAGGQARHAGRADFHDLQFSKYLDGTSAFMSAYVAGGNILKTAIVSHFSAQQKEASSTPVLFLEITISDVIITSYSLTWSGNDLPIENISLNYGKIQWSKKEMDNTSASKTPAAVTTTWDLAKNTP